MTDEQERTRAANGETRITRTKDDKAWETWFTMGKKPDGRLDRRHIRNVKKQAVFDRVEALRKQKDRLRGRASQNHKLTVIEWVDEWLDTIELSRPPGTFQSYSSVVKTHVDNSTLADMPIVDVGIRDVSAWVKEVQKKSTAKAALRARRTISPAFTSAVQNELITTNPFTHSLIPAAGRNRKADPARPGRTHASLEVRAAA